MLPGMTFLMVWLCVVCGCVISAVFFLVSDGIKHPLSQQVKIHKIAKNMIPNANFAERKPKEKCDIHKEKYGSCGYFNTQMLPRVTHTFTKNIVCV
jgi:hypothetical protein